MNNANKMDNGKPDFMLNRDGTMRGEIRNLHSRPCNMEGCTGHRIHVRWPNNRSTYPCSKGCKVVDSTTWQIV